MEDSFDIVLLVLDTQRADRLSCYGHTVESSPILDRLANEGVQFARPVAPAQWTMPTHTSLFTGLYPSEHTVDQMEAVLPPAVTPLAQRLTQAGYHTAGFSHNPLIGVVKNHITRGFQQFTNYNYLGAGLLSVNLSRPSKKMNATDQMREWIRFLAAETLGYSQRTPLNHLSPLGVPLWQRWLQWRGRDKSSQTAASLTAVADLLINRAGLAADRPIFTFINLMGTHIPYSPPRPQLETHLARRLGRTEAHRLLQKANRWQADVTNWLDMPLPTDEQQAILDGVYDAEVAAQDEHIGRLIDRLKQSDRWARTLFIVTADHGDHLGEKKRLNHAFGIYEPLTHVPLLMHEPSGSFAPGTAVDEIVSTRRLFHTILTAAGAATPDEERLSLLHGRETAPVLAEGRPLNWAITRLEKQRPGLVQAHGFEETTWAAYRDGYKLLTRGERRELYNLTHDPLEKHDLTAAQPQRVADMTAVLQQQIHQLQPAAPTAIRTADNDEAVQEHLRNLGYIE